ncbi:MAG TPA: ABC transporter permease [Anaerolineae bacterium]|nr:ABC transporter permease [Anaerolineae bacterium]
MIIKSLLRRKTRTLLTMAGVAIGVAAIVALGAMAEGFVEAYGALGGGSGADLLVMQADSIDIAFSAVDEEVGRTLAGLSGVEDVSSMIYTYAATEGTPYFIVFGYEPDGFAIQHFKIVEGEGLTERAARHGGRPLILGRAVADDLDKEVGDAFRLYESVFRIVGIYETGEPIEDGAAVVLLSDAQVLSKHPHQANAFLLKLKDGDDAEQVRQRIERHFSDLTATLSSDLADAQDMLAYVQGFTWAVSFLAVLIGGVGVMNTVLMSIFERTREFGTLRALGWHPRRILGLVLGESLALCGLGGLVGAGLGVGVVWAVRQVPLASGLFPATFSPGLFAQGIGVALALGLVGGVYPAWRASRSLPAEAMRAESGAGTRASRLRFGGTALRNLLRQPTRTLLTLTGIGIAMMAMVSLGSLAEGLVDEMTAMAGKGGVHLAGMEADASMDLSAIDQRIVRRIVDVPGVQNAEGFLTGYTAVGDLPFFVVFGYHPRGQAIRDFRIVEGSPLTANRQIIVGRVAAEALDKRVGQTLRLFNGSFRIVGFYETGVPFEDGGGVVSLRDAQALFGQPHKVSFLGIRLEAPDLAEAVEHEIETRFPEVAVMQVSEFSEDVADLKFMRSSTWAIAFLALLVGGAGMTNTMVMSVFERTREIGVLRALGWSKRRVLSMILRESLALSLLGGAVGVVTGVVAIGLLNGLPAVAGWVQASFSMALFVQALVTAFVLGAAGGAYPSWRASLMRPVEALRYE